MLKITGYSDRISVLPGDHLRFFVHCEDPNYDAKLVRIRSGDINPEGPGLKEEEIDSEVNKSYPGREQSIHAGSYAIVSLSEKQHRAFSEIENSFCFEAYIFPTLPQKGIQYLFDFMDPDAKEGFSLKISSCGILTATIGQDSAFTEIKGRYPLVSHLWYRLVFGVYQGKSFFYQKSLDPYHGHLDHSCIITLDNPVVFPKREMIIGGRLETKTSSRIIAKDTWNGKIDSPMFRKLTFLPDIQTLGKPGEPFVNWNFSEGIPTAAIFEEGALQLHGVLENMPTRGVTGYRYTGDETSWVHHPAHYSAIHFHDDDLYDAQWEADFTLKVPEEMRSGLYAIRLRISDQDEYLPFVVRPGKNTPKKKIALLFPTATYMAYANEHIMIDAVIGEQICQRSLQISPYQEFLNLHREYGSSLYDTHSDGSGVHYSSRLRPILNMRPKRLFSIGAGSSFLWQFNADTHITDWLEAKEFEYDMVTDEDLDSEGVAAIFEHQVIVTTTHPEYYSTKMLKALEDFIHNGGRLVYLGGNGFYWRIAFHQTLPGIIEVRRTAGTRAWETSPGEGTHSFTGEACGIWRYHNRAPNKLCGVGFAAQGFDQSSYYRRTQGADNPRAAFIFEGVQEEILGDFGLIGGGAAGMEVDRYDPHLGSPRHALVLASSENHTPAHVVAVEDIFNNYLGTDGEQNSLVRADMTFFETPPGGAVFSTGSISWSGSLSHNDYENNISQITYNVLKRFSSNEPFSYTPDEAKEKDFFDEENPPHQMGG